MRSISVLLCSTAASCGGAAASSPTPPAPAPAVIVHAWKPAHGVAIDIAHQTIDQLAHDPSGARPDWILYDPKESQVVFVGSEAGYQRALAVAQTFDVAPPTTTSSAGPTDDELAAAIAGIRKVDDDHFVVDRAAVGKVLGDSLFTSRSGRVVASVKDGQPNGMKLYAIRPGSLYAALGLQNGDTVTAVNGEPLGSPDHALELYVKLKFATSFDVSIVRRGTDLVLHYSTK